jgi:hypothetical protein
MSERDSGQAGSGRVARAPGEQDQLLGRGTQSCEMQTEPASSQVLPGMQQGWPIPPQLPGDGSPQRPLLHGPLMQTLPGQQT